MLALGLGGGDGCAIKCDEIWNELQAAAEDAGAGRYPDNVSSPSGPFRLLNGDDYSAARAAADRANQALRREANGELHGMEIHEIQPVKWGGSPTDIANKVALPRALHSEVTTWWNRLQRYIH
jgi:hypothetical protein